MPSDDKEGTTLYPPDADVKTVPVGMQIDLTLVDLASLESYYQQRVEELSEVRSTKGFPDHHDWENDEKLFHFYTRISSFTVLMAMFNLVSAAISETPQSKLSKFRCCILTLMKLQLHVNASNYDLGFRFGVSASTISQVLSKWIEAMNVHLSFLITWPDHTGIQKTMPFCFRPSHGLSFAFVIDCFKLYIEKHPILVAKSCTWSQYKHHNTAKYLIRITPQRVISSISNGRRDRVSDIHIVENSGYLDNLLPGDVVRCRQGI